jgi:bile acid:Na+ symporter, BASS family
MDMKQLVLLALQVSIVLTVFGFGLKATVDDLLYLFRRPALLVRSILAVLVVMPILAIVFTRVFDFSPTAEIALLALAISPVPPLLPQREAKGGGQSSYALALMSLLALLAIAAVPLWAQILQAVLDRPLSASPTAIAGVVLKMAVLPLLAGIALRAVAPAAAAAVYRAAVIVATILLPLAVLLLLFGVWRAVWNAIGGGSVVSMIAFVLMGLLVGHVLGGPDREHSVVLALSSACRHPAIALSIASTNFPDQHFGGIILLYLVINLVVGIPYVAWQRKQHAIAVPASS